MKILHHTHTHAHRCKGIKTLYLKCRDYAALWIIIACVSEMLYFFAWTGQWYNLKGIIQIPYWYKYTQTMMFFTLSFTTEVVCCRVTGNWAFGRISNIKKLKSIFLRRFLRGVVDHILPAVPVPDIIYSDAFVKILFTH